jgi:putative phosphoribosyl transferase
MDYQQTEDVLEQIVTVALGSIQLKGELVVPATATGITIFAYCNSSNIFNTHIHHLARLLRQQAGIATILIHLLTPEEEAIDQRTKHYRSDVGFLASRLIGVTDWLFNHPTTRDLKIGYFGNNGTSCAALLAATARPNTVGAIACRSGQTDLACPVICDVQVPTLLIVGGNDLPLIAMNEDALAQIPTQHKRLEIVPDACHQFNEPGALEQVAQVTSDWFKSYLAREMEEVGSR